jgi:hypothetical protein
MDRVVSFSIKPTDKVGQDNVRILKDYAEDTGISFSFLILAAITKKNEELKLKSDIESKVTSK